MTNEQAYINGFVKRAAEYGFNENEAIALLKNAGMNMKALTSAVAPVKTLKDTVMKAAPIQRLTDTVAKTAPVQKLTNVV